MKIAHVDLPLVLFCVLFFAVVVAAVVGVAWLLVMVSQVPR